jgi:hypothetical protein
LNSSAVPSKFQKISLRHKKLEKSTKHLAFLHCTMLPDRTIGTMMLIGGALAFAYYTFWIIISVRGAS